MQFDSQHVLIIKPEDRIRASIYFNLIQDLIRSKSHIPFDVADKFLRLLHDGKDYEFAELSKQARKLAEKAIARLATCKA